MKKSKVPNLVFMAILTAITAVFWAFFGVYRIFADKPAPEVPREIVEPMSPDLEKGVIDLIQQRILFEESQIPQTIFLPSPSPEAEPVPSPTPEATESPSPTPEESPTATISPSPST